MGTVRSLGIVLHLQRARYNTSRMTKPRVVLPRGRLKLLRLDCIYSFGLQDKSALADADKSTIDSYPKRVKTEIRSSTLDVHRITCSLQRDASGIAGTLHPLATKH